VLGLKENSRLKRALAVCIAIAILLAGSNVWLFIRAASAEAHLDALRWEHSRLIAEYNDLGNRYSELRSTCEALKTSYDLLQSEHAALQGEHASLEVSYQNLQSEYSSFRSRYDELRQNYESLKGDYQALLDQYNTLVAEVAEYEALQQDYASLQTEYQNLQKQYDALKKQYDDLFSDYNLLKEFFDRPLSNKRIPTLNQLLSWLGSDPTNTIGYYYPDFVCKDFAVMLSIRARTQYWDMGVVAIWGYKRDTHESYAHTINAIIITEGLVYVEPQNDHVWWYTEDHIEIRTGLFEIDNTWVYVEKIKVVLTYR